MWRIAFFVLLLSGNALAEPPEENRRDQNNTNTIERFKLEGDGFYWGEYGTHYAFLANGSDEWYGAWVRYKNAPLKSYLSLGRVQFPVPEEDAILPAYDRFYRVSGKPKDFTSRTFTLIKQDALPDGLGIEKDSMIVPLEKDGVGRLSLLRLSSNGSVTITVSKIDLRDKTKIAYGTAVTDPIPPPGEKATPENSQERTETLELKEGDVRRIDQRIFTVRRIVPKDYKGTKTVGWVEFGVDWEPRIKRMIEASKPPKSTE